MGKKGSWFSAIKRVFIPNSKEKLVNGTERKNEKEKKKKGRDVHSFIPLFRGPSSIEKILGDAEREHQNKVFLRPPTPSETPKISTPVPPRASSPRVTSPRAVNSPRAASSPRATASQRAASPRAFHQHKEVSYRPEPTLRNHHIAAIRIQAAYRGYMARRSFRALRGLVRLQGVVRGQNVKRQTANAMKCMQMLVRVQSQIQSRRIQMLENQAIQRQSQYKNDKELENSIGKWTLGQPSDAGNNEDWDDSQLTKEQIEARMERKVEAVMKRERAMAYAYSHQLWKTTPKSAQASMIDLRTGGFPWWWNWLERQLPPTNPPESQATKSILMTPTRPTPDLRPSPRPQASNYRHQSFGFDHLESLTPKSSKSAVPARAKTPLNRVPQSNGSSVTRHQKPRASAADSAFDVPLRDDDSLTSCPPFSVPNYMTPTVSAKAKVRANSNPKERYPIPGTPNTESKRRLSFPLGEGIGNFKWNKGSLFSGKDSTSQRVMERHQSLQSTGNLSVDSTVSLPATVGRKAFNRFV